MFSTFFKKGNQAAPTNTKSSQNNQAQAPAQAQAQAPADKASAKPALQREKAQSALLPQKSPEERRKEDLAAERDGQAPVIAAQLYNYMLTSAHEKTQQFLLGSKEALALRDNIMKAATTLVKANMDSVDGATAEEKADAKKFAQEHVERAGIVANSLRNCSKETVQKTILSSNKDKLEGKAKQGFDSVVPLMKTPLQNQVAEAKKQAIKSGKAAADSMLSEFVEQIKVSLTSKVKQDSAFLSGGLDVKDLGKDETQLRHTLNDNLVADSVIDTVYDNKLFNPIKLAVTMKLGVGRSFFSSTSKETKDFMKKLGNAANEEASAGIDALITGSSDLEKKYYGMLAKVEANSLVGAAVDTAVENKAREITYSTLPPKTIKNQLKTAAQSSSYDVARVNQGEAIKISEAAKKGATIKAIELLKVKQTEAVATARMITKGKKSDPAIGPDTAEQVKVEKGVKKQVRKDDNKLAKTAIQQAIDADSMENGLNTVGKIINMAVPNVGDSSSFDFELKIPIAQSGAYILFGLGAEASREQKELTVNAQITFGAGFQTFGLDANFRAGLFIESKGKDANNVMKLISYGMYREMRNVAPKAADSFWGNGGKSGMSKTEEAELWAAMVEQKHMLGDNYVDVGLVTKLQADINAGVAKMGGELGFKWLSHYDKETIEDRVAKHQQQNQQQQQNNGNSTQTATVSVPNAKTGFGGLTDLSALKDKSEALRFKPNKKVFEAGLNTEVKLGGNTIGFGLEGTASRINGALRELEISGSGSIPFAYGEDAADWVKIASKVATPIAGGAKNLLGILQSKIGADKEPFSKGAGSLLDTGSDVMFAIPQFDQLGKSLAEKIQGDETVNDTVRGWLTGDRVTSGIEKANKIVLSSSLDLSVKFKKEWTKDKVSKGWEIVFEAAQTKKFEVDAEIVKVSVEKSKRLGKIGFGMDENGGLAFKGGILGFETKDD